MQALNDATVRGIDFAKAVRFILPRQPTGQLGYIVICPAGLGAIRFESVYATAEVAAEGVWTNTIHANARHLRGFAKGRPPARFRLVFFERRLTINDSTISALLVEPSAVAVTPADVSTNRLGSPGTHIWPAASQRRQR